MIAYDVWLSDGSYRFASAASKLAAAEIALDHPMSPRPPASDLGRTPACLVSERDAGDDIEEPFWRADEQTADKTEHADSHQMPVEDLNASNDK